MDEVFLLLALLGLPLLSSEIAEVLVAVAVFALGLSMVLIGGWAWLDHRRQPTERRRRREDADTVELERVYRGKHRQPNVRRLTLRPGSAADLNQRATTEARRQLAEQDPDDEGGLPLVTWRIEEGSRNG